VKKGFCSKKKTMLVAFCVMWTMASPFAFANESSADDLSQAIKQQEILLQKLNAQKQDLAKADEKQKSEMAATIKSIEDQQIQQQKVLTAIQAQLGDKTAATTQANMALALKTVQDQQAQQQQILTAIQAQLGDKTATTAQQSLVGSIAKLQDQQTQQQQFQEGLKATLDAIQANQTSQSLEAKQPDETTKTLIDSVVALQQQVNLLRNNQLDKVYQPAGTAPVMSDNANTQDAVGAERDAEMNFSYVPGGLYKIYCKVGYLTDVRFHPGEKVTFVGGGDTSKWMIDTANTDSPEGSIAHLYIKPVSGNATTNLIINTTKHSYQILVNASNWYNPIVNWTYSSEEQLAGKIAKEKDSAFFVSNDMNVTKPENLNYNYKIENDKKLKWAPTMVFDDGAKTYIKLSDALRTGNSPVLYIKEKNSKKLALVNYRIKDNYYIVDRLFDQAELRVTEKEFVRISAKR